MSGRPGLEDTTLHSSAMINGFGMVSKSIHTVKYIRKTEVHTPNQSVVGRKRRNLIAGYAAADQLDGNHACRKGAKEADVAYVQVVRR